MHGVTNFLALFAAPLIRFRNQCVGCIGTDSFGERRQSFVGDHIPVARIAQSAGKPAHFVRQRLRHVTVLAIEQPHRRANAAQGNARLMHILGIVVSQQQLHVYGKHRDAVPHHRTQGARGRRLARHIRDKALGRRLYGSSRTLLRQLVAARGLAARQRDQCERRTAVGAEQLECGIEQSHRLSALELEFNFTDRFAPGICTGFLCRVPLRFPADLSHVERNLDRCLTGFDRPQRALHLRTKQWAQPRLRLLLCQ